MSRIYLASSWRNEFQPDVVSRLRERDHDVYDFRNPPNGPGGFQWEEVLGKDWEATKLYSYIRELLNHPRCAQGWMQDHRAMEWCEVCVLLLPSGNSAHIEAGWCKGRGKRMIIYIPHDYGADFKPDLMYLEADSIVSSFVELYHVIEGVH